MFTKRFSSTLYGFLKKASLPDVCRNSVGSTEPTGNLPCWIGARSQALLPTSSLLNSAQSVCGTNVIPIAATAV